MRYIIKSLDKSKLVKKIIIDKNGKKTTKWVSRKQFEKDKKKTAKKEVKKPVKKEAKKVISKKSAKHIIDKRKITVKKTEPLKSDKKIAKLIKKVTPETRNKTINKILGTTEKKKTVKQAAQDLVKNTPFEKDIQKSIDQFKPKFSGNGLDYTDYPPMAIVNVNKKDILTKERPPYIPEIDEKTFARNGYKLSFMQIENNKFVVATNSIFDKKKYWINNTKQKVMTLDEIVCTNDYYIKKAKALQQIEIEKKINEKYDEISERILNITGKKATKEQIEKYIKKGFVQIKQMASNKMSWEQYYMITAFTGKTDRIEIWNEYNKISKNLDIRKNDIELQTEDFESTYTKGRETSYGDINTNNSLFKNYGVLVKRQNGDEITKNEISEIKTALDDVYKVFGNRKSMSEKFNLKISHAGEKRMHASKFGGLFIPSMHAIGVTFKNDTRAGLTLSHEFGHFIDYYLGKNTKNSYASDVQNSLANDIASTFRKKMFNKQLAGNYWNRTCECFARSLETYHAHKTGNPKYYDEANFYVRSDTFKGEIMPLIDQFLKENDKLLKSMPISII